MTTTIRLAYKHPDSDWTVLGQYDNYDRATYALNQLQENFPNTHFELLDGALAGVA